MSISLEDAKNRVLQLKNEAERSAGMHNISLGRLAEAEALVTFLTAKEAELVAQAAKAVEDKMKLVPKRKPTSKKKTVSPSKPKAKATVAPKAAEAVAA